MRLHLALGALALTAACADGSLDRFRADVENADLLRDTRRAFAESYQDQPFEAGAVSVIADEGGQMRTFSLTPCRGNTRICGGAGHVGQVVRTPDYVVVQGAYAGRDFYLSPGGDGYVLRHGVFTPLAWD